MIIHQIEGQSLLSFIRSRGKVYYHSSDRGAKFIIIQNQKKKHTSPNKSVASEFREKRADINCWFQVSLPETFDGFSHQSLHFGIPEKSGTRSWYCYLGQLRKSGRSHERITYP